jgi:hypothetical protein
MYFPFVKKEVGWEVQNLSWKAARSFITPRWIEHYTPRQKWLQSAIAFTTWLCYTAATAIQPRRVDTTAKSIRQDVVPQRNIKTILLSWGEKHPLVFVMPLKLRIVYERTNHIGQPVQIHQAVAQSTQRCDGGEHIFVPIRRTVGPRCRLQNPARFANPFAV